ncbi:MAG: VCBS repeat-containing protein [Verrucomicrobiae bacterium]
MRFLALLLSCLLAGTAVSVYSQAPPAPAAPKNTVENPSFESGVRRDNLWAGVDSTGVLAGERTSLPVLTTDGKISPTPMPVSVAIADMNEDGLLDIVAMDPVGYLHIYFNSGTKTEPKFTIGELASIFLSRIDHSDPTLQMLEKSFAAQRVTEHVRRGQRICLGNISRSGKNDLVIGNYLGEIMLLPNGSGVHPEFRQPSSIAQVLVPTMKDSLKRWGNLFAPAIWDWNHDGKDDLLVGEGSYSANSIHLLLNQGGGSKPVFEENNTSVLAYGMGLEQLTPCVVDYNGDGKMDLLVTERSGKVAVYLNSGKAWKPGETLAFDSFITVGGAKPAAGGAPAAHDPMTAATAPGLLSVGGIATIAAADMNGDGLFDLIFGKSNGKLAMSLNTGTKTEPKFAAPVDIKGDAGTPAFNVPSGWKCDSGLDRGNFYGFFSVVKETDDPEAKPADGKSCLKAGYFPSPNKIMAAPSQYTPAFPDWKKGTDRIATLVRPNFWWREDPGAPASYFNIWQDNSWQGNIWQGFKPLKNNKTYLFSMKFKGSKVTDATVEIALRGGKELTEAKLVRGDRGAVTKTRNIVYEEKHTLFPFAPGPVWSEVKGEFSVRFDKKELASAALDEKDGHLNWTTSIVFNLAPGSGVLYLDDVKIIEK